MTRVSGSPVHERGSAATELVLLSPLLVILMLFVVALGRLAAARLQVNDAAHQAARAASLARDPATAEKDARSTATAALESHRVTCHRRDVRVGLGSFEPGGQVSVTVRCSVRLGDLALLPMPGSQDVSASSSSPIDVFRSGPGPGVRDDGAVDAP